MQLQKDSMFFLLVFSHKTVLNLMPAATSCKKKKKKSVFLEEWEYNKKVKHINKAWLFGAEGEVLQKT